MSQQYVFGYGSLMNLQSLKKTLPGKTIAQRAHLIGYRRKFSVLIPQKNCLALNIIPEKDSVVEGVLIQISDVDLGYLKKREIGYICTDVTVDIREYVDGRVFTFIAPEREHPDAKILKSYLETCLGGVPADMRDQWLKETIVVNPVEDDTEEPKYSNAVLLENKK